MRLLFCALFVLTGCSSGNGSLPLDAAIADATWIEVDLDTGTLAAVALPNARALAQLRWRTTHMLFRRIPATSTASDHNLLPAGGETEDASTASSDGRSFLAVFELTQAQWAMLNRTGGGSDLPLIGVAAEAIADTIAGVQLSRLDLPDAGLWAVGCSGGRQSLFSWGDGLAETAAGTYAVHHPRSGTAPSAAATVGSLLPNPLGLFDMHGNVWETVRNGSGYEARGGAWDSPTMQCRVANVVVLPATLAVPTVGVRLALKP